VEYCRNFGIGEIIVGYNKQWKSGRKLSKRFRKEFNPIPFYTLLKMIEYKAELVGIEYIETEESDTSQTCVFCREKDKGGRITRGLFVCKHCKNPKAIHSDIQGGVNIVKKVDPHAFNYILKYNPNAFLIAPRVVKIPAI
jgi:putative transposase